MGSLSDAQLFAWIEHLEHCPSCRARLAGQSPGDTMYQDAFDRALMQALAAAPCIEETRNAAPAHLAELLQLSTRDRAAAVATESRFKTYSLASYVLESSEATDVSHRPQLALVMARLAYSIADQISPRTCGGIEALADLRAYALAVEGNAQRVCGDLAAALATFARARQVQKQGGIDPDLTGRIDIAESSLRRDLRQTQDALALLHRAAETFLFLEDHERWLKSQINRANALIVEEDFDLACAVLNDILPKTSDPQLSLMIRHNLATALVSAGLPHEAGKLFEEIGETYPQVSNPLVRNRRLWLEGLIATGLGQEEHAVRLLREASADLAKHGYACDAALARLHLGRFGQAEPIC